MILLQRYWQTKPGRVIRIDLVVWNVGLWQIASRTLADASGTLAMATLCWKLSAAVTNHSHRSTSVTSQQTVSQAAITQVYVDCTLSPFLNSNEKDVCKLANFFQNPTIL